MVTQEVHSFFEFMHKWEDSAKIRDMKDIEIKYEGEELAVRNLKIDIVIEITRKLREGNSDMHNSWVNNILFQLSMHYQGIEPNRERLTDSCYDVINQIDFLMDDEHKKMLVDYINIILLPTGFTFVRDDNDINRTCIYLKRLLIPLFFRWIHIKDINNCMNEHVDMIRIFCTVIDPNGSLFINNYTRYSNIMSRVEKVLDDPDHLTKVIEMLEYLTKKYR